MKGSWLNNPCRGPEDNEDAERDVPDHADLLRRLRANLDKYPGFVNLNADAATAIETLLAQQKLLVAEVEAARVYERFNPNPADNNDEYHRRRIEAFQRVTNARRAVNAAFPGGLTK